MRVLVVVLLISFLLISLSCSASAPGQNSPPRSSLPAAETAIKFSYPIGSGKVTQARDKDGWYNALDFGKNDHLGEDWNMDSGGNTDCGQPVHAAANGLIKYARDAGPGWGNVVIIEHVLSDGKKVETLYGHMETILKTEGTVKEREEIGKVGNANGRYLCHLHFELRTSASPMFGEVGPGYASDRAGWLDPSDFIDSHR